MPEKAPPGVLPIFLRGSTCEKYGLKTGDGVMDLVDYTYLSTEEVMKEIQTLGVMSDFEPAKKQLDSCVLDKILIVIDKLQLYGEVYLLCLTESSQSEFFAKIQLKLDAIESQRLAELKAETEKLAAEEARLNAVFIDKPLSPRPWVSAATTDTDVEIRSFRHQSSRDSISHDVSRPRRLTKQNIKLGDRKSDFQGIIEFRAIKDPNFKTIRESDIGIQIAPTCIAASAQTNWFRSVNKSVQYESAKMVASEEDVKNSLLSFLEKATVKIERSLQQNETVDIYHETFRIHGDEENADGIQAENELREIKNFADPNYTKSKTLSSIDWLPKSQGVVAVSAVRNISFDERMSYSGQTATSYIIYWDFRQLVKPMLLLQCPNEVFTFKFCKGNPNIVVGGCLSGQVVLWDTTDAMAALSRKGNRGGGSGSGSTGAGDVEEEDVSSIPISPKYTSNVDYSHRRNIADMFWLPPNTQFNYRGQLVAQEHLDGKCYQFVTVSGDGLIMVWDTRFEQIAAEELKHVGRAKHVPIDKSSSKDASPKLLWGPIFKAQIKRVEGVGELSICRICGSGTLKSAVAEATALPGDFRSHFILTTEEGDIIFADLSSMRKAEVASSAGGGKEGDDDDEPESTRDYVRWISLDHPRPAVALQHSPYFPDIVLSVGDWNFHIWKVGDDKPLFRSPISKTYLTSAAWSPSRPAVIFVACADGEILAWDFTDTSFHPSIELKATHSRITSMEFQTHSSTSRQQLLAVGDETGTLHVFEMPRNLVRPVHKEETIMGLFLERESQRNIYMKDLPPLTGTLESRVSAADNFSGMEENKNTDENNGNGNGNSGSNNNTSSSSATTRPVDKEIQRKEEEEFTKMEALFLTELNLKADELPSFARPKK